MRSGNETVFILLERNNEDRLLLREIDRIANELFDGYTLKLYQEMPLLGKLANKLCREIAGEDDERD